MWINSEMQKMQLKLHRRYEEKYYLFLSVCVCRAICLQSLCVCRAMINLKMDKLAIEKYKLFIEIGVNYCPPNMSSPLYFYLSTYKLLCCLLTQCVHEEFCLMNIQLVSFHISPFCQLNSIRDVFSLCFRL